MGDGCGAEWDAVGYVYSAVALPLSSVSIDNKMGPNE